MGGRKVWKHWSFDLCFQCLWLLMIPRSSCRGAVGCILRRWWKIPLAGEEKHLDGALRQIIELIQQVTKQWGGRKIMSLKILIDLECSSTLVDEIYSYQVFFLWWLLLFILFGSKIKPVAILVFYLNLQLFRILLLLLSGGSGGNPEMIWILFTIQEKVGQPRSSQTHI